MHCDIDLEAHGRSIGLFVSPRDRVAPGAPVAFLHHWRKPAAAVRDARDRLKPGDHAALVAEHLEQAV